MIARHGLPTGKGTAPKTRDVADPHPSDEEHYTRERHPGGARPPRQPASGAEKTHTGKPPKRPKNAENS